MYIYIYTYIKFYIISVLRMLLKKMYFFKKIYLDDIYYALLRYIYIHSLYYINKMELRGFSNVFLKSNEKKHG